MIALGPRETMMPKQKIAVLGGGLAALTAAFELTDRPGHEDLYEITVYQMGWRLGGKGASGRNRAHADRIEEHGLHVLMGFYHNTFSLLRRCYEELGRAPGTPLATLGEAVKPHDLIVIADQIDGRWEPWPLRFPPLPGEPGVDAPDHLAPLGYLKRVVAWMHALFTGAPETGRVAPGLDDDEADVDSLLGRPHAPHPRPRHDRDDAAGSHEEPPSLAPPPAPAGIDPQRLAALVDNLETGRASVPFPAYLYLAKLVGEVDLAGAEPRLLRLLRRFRGWLSSVLSERIKRSTPLLHLFTLLDLGLTTVIGALADGVERAPDGWFSLDDHDLRDWLDGHGASPATRDGALVRSLYNLAFAAPGGLSAGTMIHAALRIVLDYRGGLFQKMQAGMGDVIFAPLYLVLKRRGVKFAFFHRVASLALSESGRRIGGIELGVQARPGAEGYDPLYDVDGLPCWPSEPKYDVLDEGDDLRMNGGNLESWWAPKEGEGQRWLEAGRDFDKVILGISIGAFPFICKQLIAADDRFRAMVENVRTTQTQAVQLWFEGPLESLGWKLGSPVLDGFAGPFDTWADMSHLLPRERWPAGAPQTLAYLCSRLEDERRVPVADAAYPEEQAARVKENAIDWLNESAHGLWPAVAQAKGGFDWSSLADPEGRRGMDRLDAQYWQATMSPSERYVLSVPGSTKFRLRANESGFENLVLAGDWVRTGLNVGCAEGAVMAGMQAARAISGWPERIVGDE
jgi:uncharacterized protein with NAD-binding domain and iron-sulfur cluster